MLRQRLNQDHLTGSSSNLTKVMMEPWPRRKRKVIRRTNIKMAKKKMGKRKTKIKRRMKKKRIKIARSLSKKRERSRQKLKITIMK